MSHPPASRVTHSSLPSRASLREVAKRAGRQPSSPVVGAAKTATQTARPRPVKIRPVKKRAPQSANIQALGSQPIGSQSSNSQSAGSWQSPSPRPYDLPRQPLLTPHRRKVLWAGAAITLLATATILTRQVSSQAIPDSNCAEVIKSGGEISRGQLSELLAMPENTSKETVRQAIAEPYCALPAMTEQRNKNDDAPTVSEREAYPLAFDPEAWVVVSYVDGRYSGYDFVFKP
ncbi:MAG: hypothetical protein AAFU53_07435 [Cyanobacteria bacterium J06632_3]